MEIDGKNNCTILEGSDALKSNFELERVSEARRVIQHLDICNIDNTHSSAS